MLFLVYAIINDRAIIKKQQQILAAIWVNVRARVTAALSPTSLVFFVFNYLKLF